MVRWDIFLNFVPSLPERVTKWRFHAQGIKRDMRGQPRHCIVGHLAFMRMSVLGRLKWNRSLFHYAPNRGVSASKLIAYFNPSSRIMQDCRLWWIWCNLRYFYACVCLPIIDTVDRNGQDWRIGLLYVFHDRCTNATRSGNSGTKDTTTLTAQSTQKPQVTQPVTVPAKKTTASKTAKPL